MINSQIQKYFKFLSSSEKAVFTCSFMRFDSDGVVPGFGCMFLGAAEIEAGAIKFPAADDRATLHTTLNQTNLSGRRTENIAACRVLCVDLDRKVEDAELEVWKTRYVPQLIVESSPGKYHMYWKVTPCLPLDRWRQFQLGLAWKFGGDKNAAGLTAMMRVPGVERICKDGAIFMPTIVWEVQHPGELTEKGVLAKFPEIGKWSEEGTKALAEERKKIGELARAAWRARKNGAGGVGAAFGAMPDAGRNNALYIAVKEKSFVEELSQEEAVELGAALNRHFPAPLDDWEVRKTVGSAWRKAQAGLERRRERDGAAIGMLGERRENEQKDQEEAGEAGRLHEVSEVGDLSNTLTDSSDSPPVVLPARHEFGKGNSLNQQLGGVFDSPNLSIGTAGIASSNGTSKIDLPESLVQSVVTIPEVAPAASQQEPPAPEARRAGQLRLPKSIGLAGIRLGEILWEKDREKAIGMLAGGLSLKNYEGLADYVCEKWGEIGVFRKDGPVVFLEGRSKWGSVVYFGVGVDRDNFILVVSKALHGLGVACRKSGDMGATPVTGKGGPGSQSLADSAAEQAKTAPLRKLLKRLPTQAQLGQIGKVCWAAACGWKPCKRQSGDIIVFQNGVLNLNTGQFERDDCAPLKYSHPVACRFNEYVCKELEAGKVLEEIVPRFAGYMQDWFPGDRGIVKVLLRYFGYCMTTDYGRQMFAFFYGPTRAGKGSICRTACALLGDANYYSADYEVLDKNFKTAGMHDKLLISIEEAGGMEREVDKRMNYLKKLLGGEKVTFERKYAQPFDDNMIGKFVLQSNEPPQYQDKQHAIRARMVCVGFEKSFEYADAFVDPAGEILREEADALGTLMALAWARGRSEARPFSIAQSRALQVGEEELGEAIDVVGTFVRRFCSYGDEKTKCSTLKLALEIVLEVEERSVAGRLESALKREISVTLPRVKFGIWHDNEKKSQRVFAHLHFDIEKFKQKYENDCEIGSSTAVKYHELLEVTGQLQVLQ